MEGLFAGTYEFIIVDANGCGASTSVTLTDPAQLTAQSSVSDVSCNGAADGTISITPGGGTTPYEYSMDGGAFQTSAFFDQLEEGTYPFTIRDANGCTFDTNATVSEPDVLSLGFSVANVSCNGASDGTLTAIGQGGTAPYEYSIDGGAFQTDTVFDQLDVDDYSFTIRDANGCTASADTTITQPDVLAISVTQENNSDFTVSGSGGMTPYVFAVDEGAFQSSGSFENLSPGNHTFTVQDTNGCEVSSGALLVLSTQWISTRIQVYPNPVRNTLMFDSPGKVDITLHSLDGKLIMQKKAVNGSLNIKDLDAGTYIIELTYGEKKTTHRIVKTN